MITSTMPRDVGDAGVAPADHVGLVALPAVVVAIVARAILFVATGATLTRLEPSFVAANVNAGRGFAFDQYGTTYYALKEPLYIGILAAITHVTQSDVPILVVQWLCGAAAAVAVALVTRQLTGDDRAAAAAGVIAALNPFLVHYDTAFVHPLSMDTFLFVLTTGMNLRATDAARPASVVAAGLVTGVALWQRATLMFSGAALWAAAILLGRERRRVGHAVLWAVMALAVVSPWL